LSQASIVGFRRGGTGQTFRLGVYPAWRLTSSLIRTRPRCFGDRA
jgi:hypothetical protein